MKWMKLAFLLPLYFILHSCLEPFSATVGDDATNLLVVDGLISNENAAHKVILTRSLSNIDQEIIPVTGALVIIEDDLGNKTELAENEDGIYETDPNTFQGVPGRTYQLYIKTQERKVYQSEPCFMQPPSEIDEVYYSPGNNPDSISNRKYTGLGIFVSGHAETEEIEYLRWAFEEDWKFRVPFGHDEVPAPDGSLQPVVPKRYCWKSAVSSKILLHAFSNQTQQKVEAKELYFIDSENTDKLNLRYSTIIKQYSISKDEYDFWRKLDQSNSDVSNIFGEQPYTIKGNIKNIDNPDENVLGYFQVAGVATKRMYIDNSEIRPLRLPMKEFYITCSSDSLLLADLNEGSDPNNPNYESIYEVYDTFILSGDYGYELAYMVETGTGTVIGLAVSTAQCCDCTLQGELDPPDFWVD